MTVSKPSQLEAIIDNYYGEAPAADRLDSVGGAPTPELAARSQELENCLEKMDLLKGLELDWQPDLMGIIAEGERIREEQFRREEGITFSLAATIIVSSLGVWSAIFGPEVMLYLQMMLVAMATFGVMPLIRYFNR